MSGNSDVQKVSYLCDECGAARSLNIEKDVHLQRRELEVNGLASYVDVHANKEGTSRHGIKLFIDKNFHVRTNNVLKVKGKEKRKPSTIPMPGFKTKNLTTRYEWDSWSKLELEIQTENIKFVLEKEQDQNQKIGSRISTLSELGSVSCEIDVIVEENSSEVLEYISGWIAKFCNSLELAASLHIDLIPEVLRYIDHHVHRRITYSDETIISILIDKSSILIPDKSTMEMIGKYGPAMKLIGLNPEKLGDIAKKLSNLEKFSMNDIQNILESELEHDTELEEEFIVLALFYLISLDAFDYKLSYLQTLKP